MTFISDDFLLPTESGKRLFHDVAKNLPIIDYHSHLCPQVIAQNRPFENLYDLWLSGDHYKWRAMRAAGVSETFCTGAASPKDKFLAWASTVPKTLRNPLYHWTHLELKRYFNIDMLLNEQTALSVWDQCNEALATKEFLPQAMLQRFSVKVQCTTDDPADSLQFHQTLSERMELPFRVYPTFRPDKVFSIQDTQGWNAWLDRLESTCGQEVGNLDQLLEALESRHTDFHNLGCRMSDHGLSYCFGTTGTRQQAEAVFKASRVSKSEFKFKELDAASVDLFGGFVMRELTRWDHRRSWTKQLHLGPRRNNNTRLLRSAGTDIGCDSIGDWRQADRLCEFLDDLDQAGILPRMIIYNLNPADNYAIATAIGNYQDGSVPGKMQWGSGWWFLDQKDGMTQQINALSNLGLLSQFVGMLTDSRSFMSFPRHEYFRRIFCDLIGSDIEAGLIPADTELSDGLVQGVCFQNARDQLGFQFP